MSLTDTHRKLGVGEFVAWGDVKTVPDGVTYMQCDNRDIGTLVTEDTYIIYYRPLIREAAPHIFDERNAPGLTVTPDQKFDATNWGWPEQPGSKVEVAPEGSKALTFDDGKAPLAYIPWAAVDEMAMVQAYGHKKYKDWNNFRKGMEVGRNLSCALRHIRDYMNGIDLDAESGRSHLGHAMCRLAFVLQNQADGVAIDDRYKGGAK